MRQAVIYEPFMRLALKLLKHIGYEIGNRYWN